MALRLFSRCVRLFGVASIQSVSTKFRTALPQRSLASLVSNLHSSPNTVATGRRGTSDDQEAGFFRAPERTEFDDMIENADNFSELMKAWKERGSSANQATRIIAQIRRICTEKGIPTSNILKDPCFQQLLQAIDTQISTVWNGNLVGLLRCLGALGLASEHNILRSVQHEIHWRLRRLTYKHLVLLVDFFSDHASTDQQRELYSSVVKQLELRWTEITEPRTIALLMNKVGHLFPTLMDRLEDKALELAEKFTPEDARRVALALATQNRRSVPLLRALSYHLSQWRGTELKTGLLLDLAFAYGKLNFHQSQVFQRIAADLLPRVHDLSASDATRCAKSFAFLKWLNLPLFEAFTQHILDNSKSYNSNHLCNMVLAFARLNYQPSKADEFFDVVHKNLGKAMDQLDPFLQVDLVWSLCILQKTEGCTYIQTVLEPSFCRNLTGLGESQAKIESYKLKLMHINATARLECPEYQGVALPEEMYIYPEEKKPSPLQSGLREALCGLTGDNADMYRTAINTVHGWLIDGELLLNSENKPIPLGVQPIGTQAGGCHRIAFLACEFPHYVSKSKDLLGRFVMQRRHLQRAGYLIVDVPYFEWLELKSDWQRVAYLKDKIGKTIAEDMAK
ncbi:FAST kinase domain-containing protein 4 [Polypterus senegalus]